MNYYKYLFFIIAIFLFTACADVDEKPAPASEIYYFLFAKLYDNGTELQDNFTVPINTSFRLKLEVNISYDMSIIFTEEALNAVEKVFYYTTANQNFPRVFDILYQEGKIFSDVSGTAEITGIKAGSKYTITLRLRDYGTTSLTDNYVTDNITIQFK